MSTLAYILLFTFLGSIGALVGGLALLSREKFALKISHLLSSFAAGVLLGAAFFDLLPEAVDGAEEFGINVFLWTFMGIIFFFLIERFIYWFHHHHHEYLENEKEPEATIPLIIFGDTAHNFIDGVVIAATFMVSIPLGVVTAIAVAAHEIPQEIGDFGLLLHKGLTRARVIGVNILSAAAAIAGAIATYLLGGETLEKYLPIFLAVTAGFFIYIATSDLIPEIHHEKRSGFAVVETLFLIAGSVVVFFSVSLLEAGR